MLTRKKNSLGRKSVPPTGRDDPPLAFSTPVVVNNKNSSRMSVPSSSSSSSSSSGPSSRRRQQTSLPASKAAEDKGGILEGLLPSLKDNLFSTEVNNLARTRQLKSLLNCLADWGSINDAVLFKLIASLKENVEGLDDRLSSVVSQTLDADWCSRSPKVVKAFEEFIFELLVVKPSFCGPVLHSLIRKFLPYGSYSVGEVQAQNPDHIRKEDLRVFDVAHKNLAKLLETFPIPRIRETCVKTMGANYPFMGKSAYVHYCYVSNLLKTTTYAPQLTYSILHLCIHKLCRIDVNVPRHHSELFNEIVNETILKEEVKGENGQLVSVTLDTKEVINSLVIQSDVNPLINIIDLCLTLVFECIDNIIIIRNNSNSSEDDVDSSSSFSRSESYLSELYDALMVTFESELLPTFSINYIQFVYFHLITTYPTLAQKYLEFLWKRTTDVNSSAVIRMQCMSYISGVLTRASVISVKVLKRWLTKMSDWANQYVDEKVKGCHWSSVNLDMHGPFYAVCQTIFYVFAFRNSDLIGSKKCTAFTNTLNLGRLVTCDLNPLKAISPKIAFAFVKAAHIHQISYCQTVLERNQRATIPTSVRDSTMRCTSVMEVNILENFLPFEPFLLPRSRKWVEPTYRHYLPYLPEVKIEKSEAVKIEKGKRRRRRTSSSVLNSEDNEDSIDMELSTSYYDKFGSTYMMDRFMNNSTSGQGRRSNGNDNYLMDEL